jgi:choice-of-anchor A domain-containing protein
VLLTNFDTYLASSNWNTIVLGDVIDYSNSGVNQTDIEGSLAVKGNLVGSGGNIPSLTVGAKLKGQPGFDANQTTLVVGGNLANRNNTIFGSTWVGGNADIGGGPQFGGGFNNTGNLTVGGDLTFNSSNSGGQIGQEVGAGSQTLVGGDADFGAGSNVFGTVQAGGNVVVHGDGMGDTTQIMAGASFTHDNGSNPYLNSRAIVPSPAPIPPSSPIDFDAMTLGLQADSAAMRALTDPLVVGPGAGSPWVINDATRQGTILNAFGGASAPGDVTLFDLGSDPSAIWNDGFFIDTDVNANIIINVGGLTHRITDFLFDYSPILSYDNVIFNFYEATDIFLGMEDNSSGIGFNGNIFAPFANVYFFNGLLKGNLVAAGLTGNGQINWLRQPSDVAEPAIIFLVLIGVSGLIGFRRRTFS